MPWNKPKTIWHWLLIVAPGAVSVALTAFGKLALSRQNEIVPGMLGIPLAMILCVVVAFHFARGAGSGGKVLGLAVVFTVVLLILNLSIAFAGCAAMQPHLDFR